MRAELAGCGWEEAEHHHMWHKLDPVWGQCVSALHMVVEPSYSCCGSVT